MRQIGTVISAAIGVGALFAWTNVEVRAELATIYFADATARTVELVEVKGGQVLWKESPTSPDIRATLRSRLAHVVFPPTGAWEDAEEAWQSGRFDEAIRGYQAVIADPLAHYYPMPGNFVSLAQERLLEIHRTRLDVEAIAKQAGIVRGEFLNLPPDYRKVDAEVEAWTLLSKQNWERALSALEKVEPPTSETFYLRGRALEGLGQAKEAIDEYAGAYVLNFGGSTIVTREALRRSSALLAGMADEDRVAELRAQLKLYRDLFGGGKLWEGASPELAKIADGELVIVGKASGELEKPASAGMVVVGESASVASLPPKEQRDFLLVNEVEERVFVVSSDLSREAKPVEAGGVKDTDQGYVFDGSGGGVRIGQIDGSSPTTVVRVRFTPVKPDGIVVDLNDGPVGGFGLYLKGGDVILTWAPSGAGKSNLTIGKAPVGQTCSVFVHAWKDGTLISRVNEESTRHKVKAGGLGLGASLVAALGFEGEGEKEAGTAYGETFLPFTGTIHQFSVGNGQSLAEIEEREIERFGKKVLLFPPDGSASGKSEIPGAGGKGTAKGKAGPKGK